MKLKLELEHCTGKTAIGVVLIWTVVALAAWWTKPSSVSTVNCRIGISELGLMSCVASEMWLGAEGWNIGAQVELIGTLRFCSVLRVNFLVGRGGACASPVVSALPLRICISFDSRNKKKVLHAYDFRGYQ